MLKIPLEITVDANFSLEMIKDSLNNAFRIEITLPISREITFFDTFDWRFYKQSLTLSRIGCRYQLTDLASEQATAEFPWRRKKHFHSWRELPDSYPRERLRSIQDIRAAIPVITVKETIQHCELRNQDDKVVLRLQHRSNTSAIDGKDSQSLPDSLKIIPVQGYDDELKTLRSILKSNGFGKALTATSLLCAALKTHGITPGEYTTKIKTAIEPDMSARTAAVLLCADMLAVMRNNETGVINNLDTEFLHDFRVAIRRTRSLLSLLKSVFPRDAAVRFKKAFAAVGGKTNRLRDCDVLLNYRDHYQMLLPTILKPGINSFFENIQRQRNKELLKVAVYLQSGEYHSFITAWQAFLEQVETMPSSKNSATPIIQLADKLILRLFRETVKDGAAITDNTPDELIHALRIDCKKLRYLMEFFAPLYPTQLSEPIARLKTLQDHLGDFNDLAVQIAALKEKILRLSSKQNNAVETAAALGGLIALLSQQKNEIRHCFTAVFANFADSDNLKYFASIGQNEGTP